MSSVASTTRVWDKTLETDSMTNTMDELEKVEHDILHILNAQKQQLVQDEWTTAMVPEPSQLKWQGKADHEIEYEERKHDDYIILRAPALTHSKSAVVQWGVPQSLYKLYERQFRLILREKWPKYKDMSFDQLQHRWTYTEGQFHVNNDIIPIQWHNTARMIAEQKTISVIIPGIQIGIDANQYGIVPRDTAHPTKELQMFFQSNEYESTYFTIINRFNIWTYFWIKVIDPSVHGQTGEIWVESSTVTYRVGDAGQDPTVIKIELPEAHRQRIISDYKYLTTQLNVTDNKIKNYQELRERSTSKKAQQKFRILISKESKHKAQFQARILNMRKGQRWNRYIFETHCVPRKINVHGIVTSPQRRKTKSYWIYIPWKIQ